MDEETVKKVAKSAHLALSDEELERYCKWLGDMLDRFDTLDGAPEEDGYCINPTDVADALRDDEPGIFIDPYELLKDMKTYENYVRGPRLL
ncbi:MAG: aspartyl/glutamyl-tRNA amidotransferase subunit C [Methanomassiliicoccaceae archaeon]|nr:aspartyl/glutamyl-tRNA amidotransferase subunit C [Methanomassiliicoccaceae archaeon]